MTAHACRLVLLTCVLGAAAGCSTLERTRGNWWELSREPSGQAPDPSTTPEAVVQVFVAREVPELRLNLPSTAIGKDYLAGGAPVGLAPSGTGGQVSVFGLLGITTAWDEGLEVNVLGLVFGLDVRRP